MVNPYGEVVNSRRMARLMQLDLPLAIAARGALLRRVPPSLQLRQLDGLLGCEVLRQV
ncbi:MULTISPECIES: hypothetical protein [Paenibacillus]|uniref:hypothetical protein n=1 Tax=Paenibacillus TaxID=44249 RepID=UPI0022B93D57|nr:hypothetical protein [Paenibacillus caseinilyticus]MCZ8521094.1 hypothetical protein [Paenibacillus caseinilyticus]